MGYFGVNRWNFLLSFTYFSSNYKYNRSPVFWIRTHSCLALKKKKHTTIHLFIVCKRSDIQPNDTRGLLLNGSVMWSRIWFYLIDFVFLAIPVAHCSGNYGHPNQIPQLRLASSPYFLCGRRFSAPNSFLQLLCTLWMDNNLLGLLSTELPTIRWQFSEHTCLLWHIRGNVFISFSQCVSTHIL